MADQDDTVTYTVDADVATITLRRSDAMNSLDLQTKLALRDAVHRAASDDSARCVVLTGTGRAFSAGQDLKEHVRDLRDPDRLLSDTVEEHFNPIVTAIATMPKPVIAAVNGVAAGAGASLAFACDFRVLADTAGFNLAFAAIALSCDSGVSWTLPRLVGRANAVELLMLPRTIEAEEALSLGLAHQVVAADVFEDAVAELAQRLASGPTLALASIKRVLAYSATHDLPESLAHEAQKMALTGASVDHRRAVEAFLEKRSPTFEGH